MSKNIAKLVVKMKSETSLSMETMVQDKVLARYIDPEENPNLTVHFDFEREEVHLVENEKV